MIGNIYIIYLVAVAVMIAYFAFVYRISPWDSGKYSRRFKYRVMKYTDYVNGKVSGKFYIIYRKYGILIPWLQLSKSLDSADKVSQLLGEYMTNDKEKSYKRKKEWLKDEEFLTEAL